MKEIKSKEEIKGNTLLYFTAKWCGPCVMTRPVIEEVEKENEKEIEFVKIDVEENPEIAAEYRIRTVPNILLIKEGRVEEQLVGAVNKKTLKEKISSIF